MAMISLDELLSDPAHPETWSNEPGIPDADTSVEFLTYFEAIIIFLQHFNEHTTIQEIRNLLASFEQRADHHFGFLFHQSSEPALLPLDSHSDFSLRFGTLVYGTLSVKKQLHQPAEPAFPLQLAQVLSRLCAWLLHTCEQSMFIWSYQEPDVSISDTLSKREREVLTLMCHGHNQDAIARQLCISTTTVIKHRQNIYQQLGVHTVRDALHVSYHRGLVSFLDELYA